MSADAVRRHWHKEPANSTRLLAESAPFTPSGRGLQVAIEVLAYPEPKVQVAVSRISGKPGQRTIVQVGKPLMFNDMNEAKDAVDLILDRLADEARQSETTPE